MTSWQVLFPLQSTARRIQRRGCLWSCGLLALVTLVLPDVGLEPVFAPTLNPEP